MKLIIIKEIKKIKKIKNFYDLNKSFIKLNNFIIAIII